MWESVVLLVEVRATESTVGSSAPVPRLPRGRGRGDLWPRLMSHMVQVLLVPAPAITWRSSILTSMIFAIFKEGTFPLF